MESSKGVEEAGQGRVGNQVRCHLKEKSAKDDLSLTLQGSSGVCYVPEFVPIGGEGTGPSYPCIRHSPAKSHYRTGREPYTYRHIQLCTLE